MRQWGLILTLLVMRRSYKDVEISHTHWYWAYSMWPVIGPERYGQTGNRHGYDNFIWRVHFQVSYCCASRRAVDSVALSQWPSKSAPSSTRLVSTPFKALSVQLVPHLPMQMHPPVHWWDKSTIFFGKWSTFESWQYELALIQKLWWTWHFDWVCFGFWVFIMWS